MNIQQAILIGIFLISQNTILSYAATEIKTSAAMINTLSAPKTIAAANHSDIQFKEINRVIDKNHTLHIRLQQTYFNYLVVGGDFILHQANNQDPNISIKNLLNNSSSLTANGKFFTKLKNELPKIFFSSQQIHSQYEKAINLILLQEKIKQTLPNRAPVIVIYVDKNKKAHFAFSIKIHSKTHQINYLIDLSTLQILFRQEVDVLHFSTSPRTAKNKSTSFELVQAGGVGGNLKIGQFIYDGAPNHLPGFMVMRDPANKICYLENDDVVIEELVNTDGNSDLVKHQYPCEKPDPTHNNLYWNTVNDMQTGNELIDGGYSPNNDVMFAIPLIKKMYQDWFNINSILDDQGKPILIHVWTNYWATMWSGEYDPGYWVMSTAGAHNDSNLFPQTSVDAIAHEYSHGVTQQFLSPQGIFLSPEMQAINEAFSDMSGQAVQQYIFHKNDWLHDAGLFKNKEAQRYFDDPTKDCGEDGQPGKNCSIKHISQYINNAINPNYYFTLLLTDVVNENDLYDRVQRNNEPIIIKTTQEYYLYGSTDPRRLKWQLTKLDRALYATLNTLTFSPDKGEEINVQQIPNNILDYITSHQLHIGYEPALGTDLHNAAGLYNHVFYLIATSPSFDVKKAFQLMIDANHYYWTLTADFTEAACGVMKSADGLHYDTNEKLTVSNAFAAVGIDVSTCN